MQINSNYRIYNTGEYEFNLTVLIPKKIYESSGLNFENYKEMFIEELDLKEDIQTEFEEVQNDITYIGFKFERLKAFPKENQNIQITVDKKKNEVLFVLNNHLSDDVFISLDALDLGHDSLKALKDEGLKILITIQMPGKIKSANGGVIDGEFLTYDLVENNMHKLIILSQATNVLPQLLIIAAIIVVIIILSLIFIKNNIPKKQHKKVSKSDKIVEKKIEESQIKIQKQIQKDKEKLLEDEEDNDIIKTLLLEFENDDDNPY